MKGKFSGRQEEFLFFCLLKSDEEKDFFFKQSINEIMPIK